MYMYIIYIYLYIVLWGLVTFVGLCLLRVCVCNSDALRACTRACVFLCYNEGVMDQKNSMNSNSNDDIFGEKHIHAIHVSL